MATVYRLSIDLACSPGDNTCWMDTPSDFYFRLHKNDTDYDGEYCISINEFSYQKDSSGELYEKMKIAMEAAEREILPELDKATDLDACIDFFGIFCGPVLNMPVYNEEKNDFGEDDCNEGLLYIQTDNHDYYNPEIYRKALAELARRKKKNQEMLRGYGLEI